MPKKKRQAKKQPIIYAFIDSQNLNLGVRDAGWKLDFKKFHIYLQEKYNVKKTFLFIGKIRGNEKLYSFLKQAGYILIMKPTLKYRKGKKKVVKGNVDAELVLHAMIEYKHYDKAIIVSGDGDFYCLVDYLIKKKKFFKLLIPNKKRFSSLLRKFRKYFLFVSDLKQYLEL